MQNLTEDTFSELQISSGTMGMTVENAVLESSNRQEKVSGTQGCATTWEQAWSPFSSLISQNSQKIMWSDKSQHRLGSVLYLRELKHRFLTCRTTTGGRERVVGDGTSLLFLLRHLLLYEDIQVPWGREGERMSEDSSRDICLLKLGFLTSALVQ